MNKGKSIGFIGSSGAGKTTIFYMLTGLLKPDSGYIKINGVSYNDLNLEYIRKRIGYVSQDPVLFNDTIKNNITLWVDKEKNNAH